MRAKALQAAFVGGVLGALAALVVCRSWLVGFVDHHSGFWPEGARHDVFAPGEALLLISVYAICSTAFTALALVGLNRLVATGITRGRSLAGEAAHVLTLLAGTVAGLIIFETLLLPSLPLPDVVVSDYVVRLPIVVGSVLAAGVVLFRKR